MEQARPMIGIVVRPDGTVPFDADVHPDVKAHILSHLTEQGHSYDPVARTRHVKIRGWKPEHVKRWK